MSDVIVLLLPVALGVAIAAGAFIVLQRTGIVAAESRQASAARRSVEALHHRISVVLDPIILRVDEARRGQLAAAAFVDELSDARSATDGLVEDARTLDVPKGLVEVRSDIVAELERAGRALDMIEHGRSIMEAARARGRELEAQTAVKRGYLNLLHAREAIGRHAARAAEYRSPTEARRDARRAG